MRIAAITALAVTLVTASGAASAPEVSHQEPAWSPDGTKIAFSSTRDDPSGYLAIYVMNADGSGTHRITNDRVHAESAPSWSPDGTKIAFQTSGSVDVVSVDGSGRHRIVQGGSCCGPRWSPKGRRIAYNWYDEFVAKVYVVKPDGTGTQLVAAPGRKDECYSYGLPTWSPDGQRIAFRAGSAGDCSIVGPFVGIVGQYRGEIRRLMRGHCVWSLDWGPKGRKIAVAESRAVSSGCSPQTRISLLDVRTGKFRVISRQHAYSVRWLPDGRRIGLSWNGRIYVMNADGSNVRELVPH